MLEVDNAHIYMKFTAYFLRMFWLFAYEKLEDEKRDKKNQTRLILNIKLLGPSLIIGNIDFIFWKAISNANENKS